MIDTLKDHPLFKNIEEEDIETLVTCLEIYEREYLKNEYIIQENYDIDFAGIVAKGSIYMEQEDYFGNKYFYNTLLTNSLFGEVFIAEETIQCSVNYRAAEDCRIIFIRYQGMLNYCYKACPHHKQLIENLIYLIATKSRTFIEKIEIISKKTLRSKILSYLKLLSKKQNSELVISTLNHTELAEYLCINRSAMIRELKNMKKDNLIDFKKNTYALKNNTKNY